MKIIGLRPILFQSVGGCGEALGFVSLLLSVTFCHAGFEALLGTPQLDHIQFVFFTTSTKKTF